MRRRTSSPARPRELDVRGAGSGNDSLDRGDVRVLLHVQHLKGVGHLRRAAALARAFVEAGLRVTVASGGMPVDGIDADGAEWVQLPAMRAASDGYRVLLDERGRPVDERFRRARRDALLAVLERTRPHALILETFPFGRRKLAFELLPLLDRACAMARPPLVVSSQRDVPEPRPDPRERSEMAALAAARFDRLLVHGDPRVVRLEDTFPEAAPLAGRTAYSGYVADARAGGSADGHGEVLVSAGGGAAGEALIEAALAAARADSERPWRVLVGPNAPARLLQGADGVTVEPNREDFPGLLRNCLVSVSQAGYNTMVDVTRAGCRAVVVPHGAGGEREQGIRASLFAARGLVSVLAESELEPARLAAAVEQAAARPRPCATALDVDGARRSAALLGEWLAERAGPP